MAEAAAPDFSQPGPCAATSWLPEFAVPDRTGGLPARVVLNVTLPVCPADADADALPFGPAPFPVLFLFNGFQNRAGWYWRLVCQVASWGVVTVQYDTPFLSMPTAAAEVRLFPALVEWVAQQANDTGSPLYGAADTTRVATGGHSRGGKIASLAFTTYPDLVQAAYLVDPVDLSRWNPESPEQPSAARALAASGAPVGIAAAGVVGSCNPAEGSAAFMWGAAGNGSWLGVLPGASHSTFIDSNCAGNAAADLLCGRGSGGRAEAAYLTAPQLLAWVWDRLVRQAEDVPAGASPLPGFFRWAAAQEVAGKLEFEVKGDAESAAWAADAAEASKLSSAAPGPAFPTAAEEEAACAAPAAEARR